MVLQEVRKIWWGTSVHGFEGQGGMFKPYTPFDSGRHGDLSMRYIYRRLAVQDSVTIGPRAYLGGDKGHAPNGYNQWLPRMVILLNGHIQKKHSVFCTADHKEHSH